MPIAPASTSSKPRRGPARREIVPLSVPELGGNEWKYLKECLDTGWVSSVGPFVERFEREMADDVGASSAVAVASGTAGLHLGLKAVGVAPEDEVLVPSLTFIAPANAVRYCNAHPVFMDADPQTWQMDADKVAAFLSQACEVREGQCYHQVTGRRVRAIVPVHLLGLACRMDRLVELARRYQLKIVEDAAEAIGVRYQGRHVGTFGDVGVFSFNGNKLMTTGGGGLVVTNDDALAAYVRYLSTQARDDAEEYRHDEVGYNYRMTNLQAALGVAQREQLESFIAKKQAIAGAYHEAFRALEGVTPMPTPPETAATYWLYTILLKAGTTVAQRQAFIQRLKDRGVSARSLWHPVHELPPYRACQAFQVEHAQALYARGVSLPCSVGLGLRDLQSCISAVKQSLR